MKRNTLLTMLLMLAATTIQAQVLIKHGEEKERIEFGNDKLVKIVFNTYDTENNGDNVIFIRQSGETMTFDIDLVYLLGFAADFTKVDQLQPDGETAILYDANTATVHIANAKDEKGTIQLFNAEGRLVKSAKGVLLCLEELPSGLYIVSYNQVLNAKIIKK